VRVDYQGCEPDGTRLTLTVVEWIVNGVRYGSIGSINVATGEKLVLGPQAT
jgi:hypothetical protein